MTREFLGSFCTDVATVVVGDPCKLIRDQSDEDRYLRFIESGFQKVRNEKMSEALGEEVFNDVPRNAWAAPAEFGGAIAATTGADGWIHVYLERDEEGRPARLIVELTAWCDPKPQEDERAEP